MEALAVEEVLYKLQPPRHPARHSMYSWVEAEEQVRLPVVYKLQEEVEEGTRACIGVIRISQLQPEAVVEVEVLMVEVKTGEVEDPEVVRVVRREQGEQVAEAEAEAEVPRPQGVQGAPCLPVLPMVPQALLVQEEQAVVWVVRAPVVLQEQ
jgi:hypothetical protein